MDWKIAAILPGAEDANCKMCTATHDNLKDRDLVVDGFPINRTITDAIQLFGELEDVESIYVFPSNDATMYPIFPFLLLTSLPLAQFILDV